MRIGFLILLTFLVKRKLKNKFIFEFFIWIKIFNIR